MAIKYFSQMVQVNRNLWKHEKTYYRLFADGKTPNGCWLVNPKMVELKDIDIATGSDVYGGAVVCFGCIGTVQAGPDFITSES